MNLRVTIDNTRLRYDTAGNPVDAHDGCLEYFEGRYWLYGTAYGRTTGYTNQNRLRIYSSPDLAMDGWTNHGDAITEYDDGMHVRSYVKRCPATGKYVMWFYHFKGWIGEKDWSKGHGPIFPVVYRVAQADDPAGPFKLVSKFANTRADYVGDGGLFVDHDGTGYLTYTQPGKKFGVVVERLRDDFLDSAGEGTDSIVEVCEAPSLFRRGDWYYLLTDHLCCYCPQGTGARVYRATHPFGPWEYRSNINRIRERRELKGPDDWDGQIIVPAQQTHIARLPTVSDDALIWMGDRWQTGGAPNRGGDLQYWSEPLKFTPRGDIEPLRFVEQWSLTHAAATPRGGSRPGPA